MDEMNDTEPESDGTWDSNEPCTAGPCVTESVALLSHGGIFHARNPRLWSRFLRALAPSSE